MSFSSWNERKTKNKILVYISSWCLRSHGFKIRLRTHNLFFFWPMFVTWWTSHLEIFKIYKIFLCSSPHSTLLTLLILAVCRTHVAYMYEPRKWTSSKQVSSIVQWIERVHAQWFESRQRHFFSLSLTHDMMSITSLHYQA